MNEDLSGSFSEFNPAEVIDRIDVHLKRIEIIRQDTKNDWFKEKRENGKKVGFLFWKKRIEWEEQELHDYWNKGLSHDGWYFDSPKYILWDKWDGTINRFKNIQDFCQLAIDAGNRTVNLSLKDALFAYNWE